MKKIIMMVAAVLVLAAPASMAQKIDAESYKAKLAKADAAAEHPKKGLKAATWIARGNEYYTALEAPTKNLFASMDLAMLKVACGEPKSTASETINGQSYSVLTYPYFKAYVQNDKLVAWTVSKKIAKDIDKTAFDSYAKAYELDPTSVDKVKEGMVKLANYKAQIGDTSNSLAQYKTGAEAYVSVYDIQSHPAFDAANSMMLYYAGYMYTIASNDEPALFKKGASTLQRAVKAGYPEVELKAEEVDDKDKGNIYYYLYHCYYGQKDADSANVMKAKQALLDGVDKFPKNQRIIDALTQLYTTEEGVGDPSELIDMIDQAIAADSSNADLWYARGRIYFALRDYDNCIDSFTKVTELAPDVFDGHFYLGLFYIYKGDQMNEEIGKKTYTENAAYGKDLDENNAIYAAAIPVLERAHELRTDDLATVEYLKSLCFRLRDEDGIMDKYNKYNELFKQMSNQ
ncbi:MAG: tetratricopeptide repeat protein [Rikenellaceae bacterium]